MCCYIYFHRHDQLSMGYDSVSPSIEQKSVMCEIRTAHSDYRKSVRLKQWLNSLLERVRQKQWCINKVNCLDIWLLICGRESKNAVYGGRPLNARRQAASLRGYLSWTVIPSRHVYFSFCSCHCFAEGCSHHQNEEVCVCVQTDYHPPD